MKYFALILEIIGILVISSGIVVEVKLKAHYGFIAITVGAFLIFVSTMKFLY